MVCPMARTNAEVILLSTACMCSPGKEDEHAGIVALQWLNMNTA